MPSSSLPPDEQIARVTPFDPRSLDRSVIAIPLLRKMEEELRRIASFKAAHPFDPEEFNSVIEFNREYPGTPEEIRARVVEMVDRAADKAREASKKRLKELETLPAGQQVGLDMVRERADIYGNVFLMEKQRHSALEEAIRRQKVGAIAEDGYYGFANLHASVIRRLLSANDRLLTSGEALEKPIIQIHPTRYDVIVDLNLDYPRGREEARHWVFNNIEEAKKRVGVNDAGQDVNLRKDQRNSGYVFARLEARVIKELVDLDIQHAKEEAQKSESASSDTGSGHLKTLPKIEPSKFRAIFRIWPDFEISACINKSIATVKADAAQNSFSAHGTGITWAVMDTGIKHDHEHFRKHSNIDPVSKWHKDFTADGAGPFDDENGHGTHVAGIIAGEWRPPTAAAAPTNTLAPFDADEPPDRIPVAVSRYLKRDSEDVEYQAVKLIEGMSGMAPRCKLVSLRVLDENGKGTVSNLIAAIGHVQEINNFGRKLLIHGINIPQQLQPLRRIHSHHSMLTSRLTESLSPFHVI